MARESSGVLQVGRASISYKVRTSSRATKKRVVVTPEGVEVVVPTGTPMAGPGGVEEFLYAKRRWVFDSVREIEEKHRKLLTQRWASGAKVQFRGRWMMLDVAEADVEKTEVVYRSKFHVRVPVGVGGTDRLEGVRDAVVGWLKHRASADLHRHGRRHATALGLEPGRFTLSEAKRTWGSCGRDGTVRVHWRLVQAPVGALEYVVAHELVHRVHRNHGGGFWRLLGTTMPDWPEKKAMLERWETEHRAV
jgi:predicted metal-dependent hydrolase